MECDDNAVFVDVLMAGLGGRVLFPDGTDQHFLNSPFVVSVISGACTPGTSVEVSSVHSIQHAGANARPELEPAT